MDDPTPTRERGWVPEAAAWLTGGGAVLGLGLTGYLAYVGWTGSPLPGCGAGDPCGEVLASPWSRVYGIPVAALASAAYLACIAAWPFARRGSRMPFAVLTAAAAAIVGGAVWFITIQATSLPGWCGGCLFAHGIGLFTAAAAVVWAVAADRLSGVGLVVGATAAAGLAVAQLVGGGIARGPVALDLPTGRDFEVVTDDGRRIVGVLGGARLDVTEAPAIGDAMQADQIVVLLIDYHCDSCRALHRSVLDAAETLDRTVAVLVLPVPLEGECNPHADVFNGSCDVARLALAVWRAGGPQAFAAYDGRLTAERPPPTLTAKRREAEALVGADRLAAALVDPWVDAQIARNVEIFGKLPRRRVPVMATPGQSWIGGGYDASDVAAMLDQTWAKRRRAGR